MWVRRLVPPPQQKIHDAIFDISTSGDRRCQFRFHPLYFCWNYTGITHGSVRIVVSAVPPRFERVVIEPRRPEEANAASPFSLHPDRIEYSESDVLCCGSERASQHGSEEEREPHHRITSSGFQALRYLELNQAVLFLRRPGSLVFHFYRTLSAIILILIGCRLVYIRIRPAFCFPGAGPRLCKPKILHRFSWKCHNSECHARIVRGA